jgi:hypothetical protein
MPLTTPDGEPLHYDPDAPAPTPCHYCCEPLPAHTYDCPWRIFLELATKYGYINENAVKTGTHTT